MDPLSEGVLQSQKEHISFLEHISVKPGAVLSGTHFKECPRRNVRKEKVGKWVDTDLMLRAENLEIEKTQRHEESWA